MPKINLGDNYWGFDIEKVKKYYNAEYVGDFPYPMPSGGFYDFPLSIFYQTHTKQEHAPYFGLYLRHKELGNKKTPYITKASYITEYIFNGLQAGDEIIYSRFRHDYRGFDSFPKSGAIVDGGFDYFKWSPGTINATPVRLQVKEGKIIVL